MKLTELTKAKASRVIGIDCSTNSLAFAVYVDGKPVEVGEIEFHGANVYERLADAKSKVKAMVKAGVLAADYIGIEAAIYMNNFQVAIKLAYIYGAVMSELMQPQTKVVDVAPITWQSFIGNKNLTKDEKNLIKKEYPGKSASWYQNKGRLMRKQRTLDFANNLFEAEITSDNAGDAVGIGYYVSHSLTKK